MIDEKVLLRWLREEKNEADAMASSMDIGDSLYDLYSAKSVTLENVINKINRMEKK